MTQKSHKSEERIALFAGSFDPFTIGHASIVERALSLFDRIIIAVGVNANKAGETSADERQKAIRDIYSNIPERVSVESYSDELTVDLAQRVGAKWLLRGVRSVKDFEYEREIADINRQLSGLETVILLTLPEHGAVSSSVVRELRSYGRDVSHFLPAKYIPLD